jgi:hypothetical protein
MAEGRKEKKGKEGRKSIAPGIARPPAFMPSVGGRAPRPRKEFVSFFLALFGGQITKCLRPRHGRRCSLLA